MSTRASDAEREVTVNHLRLAAEEGRLTVQELADRIDAAYAATTRAELAPLTADLPAPPAGVAPEPGGRGAGTSFVLGILGAGDRRGRWRVAERVTVINVLGGADLDLRQATLAGPEVEITVISILGGSDIIVPEGVHVELTGFGLLGANDLRLEGEEPPPDAPVVRVRAYSILGGTDVKARRGRRRPRFPEPPRLP